LKKSRIISLAILGLIVLTVLVSVRQAARPLLKTRTAARSAVAVVYLEGVIVGGRGQNTLLAAVGGTDAVIRQLRLAKEDPEVAAVVLRINSPGGSASASQEVHNEVMRVRDAGKPLVVSFADVAASGGYWIACAADEIVANPATITGSIGVIMEMTNLEELYRMLGIRSEVVKSGEHKDMGSSTRPLEDSERAILQAMVDDIFDQFVDVVMSGRNLSEEQVRELADGRIFTGRQALEAGLVDSLGDFADAVDRAAELGGIPGRPHIKELGRRSPLEMFFGGTRLEWLASSWPLRLFDGDLLPR
jgi:protease IV